ncbi:2-nitropropane dioxygenase NPD [Rhodopseudomonas palustris TIE-1]|uniref:NAD(P)H-dependent flavin oxidoreductase n=1 Tax=Rhodopseudomonas palustris TaxID=1076 RepID=UPI000164B7F1|nr:2-nitropropane dioxygenase NPD [Rhodopseudomonas palustris TIE-1]
MSEKFKQIRARLRLPVLVAPMLRISGPALVAASCSNGVIGSFPTVNARTPDQLDRWIDEIKQAVSAAGAYDAPYCANILARSDPDKLQADLKILIKHKVEIVLVSTGAPEKYVKPLQDIGCFVIADVASIRHARKALQQGVDGLALLTAGAGGQTGWANGFAFVRAIRDFYDGPLLLAGGVSDGQALWAARTLGCDLGLMGTRFIGTQECDASDGYKAMLVDSGIDDVVLTRGISGIDANFLRPSIIAFGLDPQELAAPVSPERAREMFSSYAEGMRGPKRWVDLWSAGHTVSGVKAVQSVAEVVDQLAVEYTGAQRATRALLADADDPAI